MMTVSYFITLLVLLLTVCDVMSMFESRKYTVSVQLHCAFYDDPPEQPATNERSMPISSDSINVPHSEHTEPNDLTEHPTTQSAQQPSPQPQAQSQPSTPQRPSIQREDVPFQHMLKKLNERYLVLFFDRAHYGDGSLDPITFIRPWAESAKSNVCAVSSKITPKTSEPVIDTETEYHMKSAAIDVGTVIWDVPVLKNLSRVSVISFKHFGSGTAFFFLKFMSKKNRIQKVRKFIAFEPSNRSFGWGKEISPGIAEHVQVIRTRITGNTVQKHVGDVNIVLRYPLPASCVLQGEIHRIDDPYPTIIIGTSLKTIYLVAKMESNDGENPQSAAMITHDNFRLLVAHEVVVGYFTDITSRGTSTFVLNAGLLCPLYERAAPYIGQLRAGE